MATTTTTKTHWASGIGLRNAAAVVMRARFAPVGPVAVRDVIQEGLSQSLPYPVIVEFDKDMTTGPHIRITATALAHDIDRDELRSALMAEVGRYIVGMTPVHPSVDLRHAPDYIGADTLTKFAHSWAYAVAGQYINRFSTTGVTCAYINKADPVVNHLDQTDARHKDHYVAKTCACYAK